jgi:DeoR family suf operon transcriptional repressor
LGVGFFFHSFLAIMTTLQQASTKQDLLKALLKSGEATAQQLAETLGISPQATRRHLKDLETEGLILHEVVRAGMGRPQHHYRLSAAGRSRFPANYDEFAVELLDTLAETVGRDRVSSILRKQWVRKAMEYRDRLGSGSLRDRVAKLVQLRQAEGYMAEWQVFTPDGASESASPMATQRGTTGLPDPVDASPVNASPVDASPVDASPVDASPVNASPVNASPVDASPVDTAESSEPQFILTEHNCAISTVAESFPSVCGHELEMFAIALDGCSVERTHWMVDGEHRCGYLIQAKSS